MNVQVQAHYTPSPRGSGKHVGARVRMRRMMLGMSQEKLGDALRLTFQQVQKYEKGTNRVGASRLHQIAVILGVPIAFFFEGLAAGAGAMTAKADDPGLDLCITRDGCALAVAFNAITDAELRRSVVDLVEQIAGVAIVPASGGKRS